MSCESWVSRVPLSFVFFFLRFIHFTPSLCCCLSCLPRCDSWFAAADGSQVACFVAGSLMRYASLLLPFSHFPFFFPPFPLRSRPSRPSRLFELPSRCAPLLPGDAMR